MKQSILLVVLALGLSMSTLMGCDEEEAQDPGAEATAEAAQEETSEPAQDSEGAADDIDEPAEETDDTVSADFDYPGFDLEGLGDGERQQLAEMGQSELCPCEDAVESLHECMQSEDRCEEADELTQTLVGAVSAESPEDAVEQVAQAQADRDGGQEFHMEDAPVKGSLDAEVVIVEFADFQCPHCRTAAASLDEVAEEFGDDVAVVFKNFPLGSPVSDQAHRAAMAAHEQGRFWEMQKMIFDNQRQIDRSQLETFARQLGINYERWQADMESDEIEARIMRDRQEGIEAGVSGTPAIFINGQLHQGGFSVSALSQRVQQELN